MKSLLLTIILFGLLSSHVAAEDYAPLFARLDADRDGQITKSEVLQSEAYLLERLLSNADANRDGQLSAKEFRAGLTSSRPEKPLTEKGDSNLPGSDALLLVLAWMDQDANLVITSTEVPDKLRPLYDQFLEILKQQDKSRMRVQQLRQQAIRFVGMSARFAYQQDIDVEVELALLTDEQWAYVERLKSSLRAGGNMMADPAAAAVLFDELDTNGDGKITSGEVPEPFADRFAVLIERADRDQDKQLSEQEFKAATNRIAALEANRPSLAETTQRVKQLLRRSDRNSDGRLSRKEVPPRMAQRFARLDENADGQLDADELSRAVENLATVRNSARNRPVSSSSADDRLKNSGEN